MVKHPLYIIWAAMKYRCHSKTSKDFRHYGGRGISVCDRWLNSFPNFLADMGERPDGMTLDRKDNGKGYYPDNCRWATQTEQMNNTRCNKFITHNGLTFTESQWSKKLGGSRKLVSGRIKRGWSEERAITEPVHIK